MFRSFWALFRRFEPQTVHDRYLGTLTSDSHGNWNGRFRFSATASDVDISLHTGDVPPNATQIHFVHDVETRFPAIWQQMRTSLFADLDDLADGTTMEQVFDSLKVEALFFFQLNVRPFEWEISCTTPHNDHIFGLVMEDFENQGFRMDG